MNNSDSYESKVIIDFEKANLSHFDTIFGWLAEPHVKKFLDNSQGHRDDILNFVNGRIKPSSYADGKYVYWIASCNGRAFAMLMTIQETTESHIDKTVHAYSIDYPKFPKRYWARCLCAL